jgi:hypothetical protein
VDPLLKRPAVAGSVKLTSHHVPHASPVSAMPLRICYMRVRTLPTVHQTPLEKAVHLLVMLLLLLLLLLAGCHALNPRHQALLRAYW